LGYIFGPYSETCFKIDAYNNTFKVLSKKSSKIIQNDMLNIDFCHRITIMLGCIFDKKFERFMEKGSKRLNQDLDLMNIIFRFKSLVKKIHPNAKIDDHDKLNLDYSSVEEESPPSV